ncbi:helix-turn-helix domain-containing protein [Streptomyces aureoverticillatus]|uniref:helix-turn-helix domain-containing protein n=1 Tax=Streptomyces aureoverticillatus TaxID=66871 RepID=UPI0013D97E88|nr:helix-turn-helix transcriptional regulator [Streptomyces aureoverticillatus]QIB44023.1 helix-turn-helix domain-containing protein [Streptomyces aureoverticillatus]
MGTRADTWQPLPGELPPEVRHHVEQLRRLKDRTGLSLVALGTRTAYSKSSWQRYLNGLQLPPREAVLALCRVAGADGARVVAGWELAGRVWARASTEARTSTEARAAEAPAPAPARRPAPNWRLVACFAFAVIALLLGGLLWVVAQVAAGVCCSRRALSRGGCTRPSSSGRRSSRSTCRRAA